MKFIQSVLSYAINFFGFWSNKVDAKALELKDKTEQEINIPVLIHEYKSTVNLTLDKQYNDYVKLLTNLKTLSDQVAQDKVRLHAAAKEIIRSEDISKTVNMETESTADRLKREFTLKTMRLEASILHNDIKYNEEFIGQQQQTSEEMLSNYLENQLNAKHVMSKLQTLQHRNNLIESRKSFEQIELGVGNYKIADIVKIVSGKEAAFEAKQFADTVMLREGTKSATDRQIEQSVNMQLEYDLNNYIQEVREDKVKQPLLN